ncbi:DDE-domain-containing protein [Zopfia rhizophila CBS 207.26]|uniref:DDE-domain-containing protein n=1 Tax=Zopfia rhizophila CBS 207.26 TaxID=1314779 RepID=A0A6A6DF27_9PEZI|nr:DDE-domain-containing protein [Zopfia rhizophila CBS 207.26]
MLQNFAKEICGHPVGKHWPGRFLKRHDYSIFSKWTDGMDKERKRADSAFKYTLYFDLLERKIAQYNVDPWLMYNMDEKGFLIGVLTRMKRIFSKRRYEEGGVKKIIQDGNHEWITHIACICADGTSLTPSLIYQAVSGNVQDTWLQDFDPSLHKCYFTSSPSGWTNEDIGYAWLTQVFNQETKEKARRQYRLLILDGHGSHVNMRFIEYCDKNKILLAIYPPHSTHTLQPLDVCLFKPLSTAYTVELEVFMDECQGFFSITKRDFFRFFWVAYKRAFTKKNILSGFKNTGLHPFDPIRVIKKFSDLNTSRPSSSSSTNSILKAEDWRRIEKLLHQVINDVCDKKAKQLNNTIHALTVENMLLKMQNQGLKKTLINEKKRRKRGKPLLLEMQGEEESNAIFWSPNKVQQARD